MFIQPDWFEVTKPGVGTNRYSCSCNDPVNKMDPGGNQANQSGGLSDFFRDFINSFFPGSSRADAGRNAGEFGRQVVREVYSLPAKAAADVKGAYDIARENPVAGLILRDVDAILEGDLPEIAGVIPIGKAAAPAGELINDALVRTKVDCSFEGSTLVLAKSAYKPIRDILPEQDLVWGPDANGIGGWHVVLSQSVATYGHEVHVTIRDLETGATQTIVSNRIHPCFAQVPEDEIVLLASEGVRYDGPLAPGHWIDAGHLKLGYRLLNPDGTRAEVVSVTERAATLDARNLTVEDGLTCFVAAMEGMDPAWVHNEC